MEFPIDRNKVTNKEHYSQEEIDIAYDFAKKIHTEFEDFIKAFVLFGSLARKTQEGNQKETKDIDILLIVDDVTFALSKELVQTYRIIVERLVRDTNDKLHVITLKFSSFWEYVRSGDPIAVNVLRDGVPIIDTGFFEPLQMLLRQGRIRPSPESVMTYFNKAPLTLKNSQWHVRQAILDLYWAVIDSAHAALMKLNEVPPSPEHVGDILKDKLVKPGVLEAKYSKTVDRFYHLMKGITHGDIQEVTGDEYDGYFKEAEAFVKEMEKFINK